jgi:molybdate transport system permease protein
MAFPILLTLRVCLICLALFSLAGPPLAFWCGRSRSFASGAASFLVMLPLVFPPMALGFMLLLIFGRNGPAGGLLAALGIRLVFTQSAVVFAAFAAGFPLVVRPLQAAMEKPEVLALEEAARANGCGPVRAFFLVTVPQTSNALISGLLLGTARASGEVGVTMMIGGNIAGRTNTLSLEIYNLVSRGEFDAAMRLCAILAAAGLILWALLEKYRIKEI